MDKILKFFKLQKTPYLWIRNNPMKFIIPIIIGLSIYMLNIIFQNNNSAIYLLFSSFFGANIILLIICFYIINYYEITFNKTIFLKILICTFINLCLTGVIGYFRWVKNINLLELYKIMTSIFNMLLSILFCKIVIKEIIIIFKKIIGIITIFSIGVIFSKILYFTFLKVEIIFSIQIEYVIRLLFILDFIINILCILMIIIYIENKEEIKLNCT